MRHEKQFTKDNGDQIRVTATLYTDSFTSNVNYNISVAHLQKGKRKWKLAIQRGETEELLALATPQEIWQTKMELWEKLKP